MTAKNPLTLDRVVEAYTKSREDIKALEKQIDEIKAVQTKREQWLLTQLQENGLKNARTNFGTVYTLKKESITVAEWDSFFEWVQQNAAYEFLQHAVSKKAVQELMGDERENPPPPGVNYVATLSVGVRK